MRIFKTLQKGTEATNKVFSKGLLISLDTKDYLLQNTGVYIF